MGTRSLTRVIPRQEGISYSKGHAHPEKALVNIYQQFDGYPEYMGVHLATFLKDMKIVNGVGIEQRDNTQFANGPGCLAASLVNYLKNETGNTYLIECEGKPGDAWEEYIYTLYPKEGEPTYMSIYNIGSKECIFVGTPQQLIDKYKTNTNEEG